MTLHWVLPSFVLLVVFTVVSSEPQVGLNTPPGGDQTPVDYYPAAAASRPPPLPWGVYLINARYQCHQDCVGICRNRRHLSGGCVYAQQLGQCMCQCYLPATPGTPPNGPNGGNGGNGASVQLIGLSQCY